mmetsp:Transcript_78961/g.229325  ORF Transcript_78961/g.229325 Transcript_78961/m.229325 type:complete len:205 (+) Transcript_78961:2602-3216(+)
MVWQMSANDTSGGLLKLRNHRSSPDLSSRRCSSASSHKASMLSGSSLNVSWQHCRHASNLFCLYLTSASERMAATLEEFRSHKREKCVSASCHLDCRYISCPNSSKVASWFASSSRALANDSAAFCKSPSRMYSSPRKCKTSGCGFKRDALSAFDTARSWSSNSLHALAACVRASKPLGSVSGTRSKCGTLSLYFLPRYRTLPR